MIDQNNPQQVTCDDIDSEEFLQAFAVSEEFHDFEEVEQQSIIAIRSCEVISVREECSICSAVLHGVLVSGETFQKMRPYKQLLYTVYEWFYENPLPKDHISFSGGFAAADLSLQIPIHDHLSETIQLGREDAEDYTAKQSKPDVWTQILGPEHTKFD